jgi:hypothetical protein
LKEDVGITVIRLMAASSAPDEPDIFSDEALAQLQHALDRALETPRGGNEVLLDSAVQRLCSEVNARRLPPEKMVVALKAAWQRLTVRGPMGEDRKHNLYERLLGRCLESYFRGRATG